METTRHDKAIYIIVSVVIVIVIAGLVNFFNNAFVVIIFNLMEQLNLMFPHKV